MAHKWTKKQIKKMLTTKAANAILRAASKTKVTRVDSHYVGERNAVDVHKLESDAFRRGMFTALQMVVDLLIQELR